MEMGRHFRRTAPVWLVEWRATCYRDPLERLRYLRRVQAMYSPPRWQTCVSACKGIALVACVLVLLLPLPTISNARLTEQVEAAVIEATPVDVTPSGIWLVQEAQDHELYSNGLRIDTTYAVSGDKRPYPVYDRETLELVRWQSGPVGILFHTTESNQAPFDHDHSVRLQRLSQWLLEYLKREKAYHYLIDRFGQVHRVVRETDSANHSGYSVWADGRDVYVNLNPSFIGISFEAQTEVSAEGADISRAQVRAARELTEMLRSKHGIPARNCVTHGQVSVAPSISRVGNHLDWAGGFPFGELGLEDNYQIPNAAIGVFGFRFDTEFLEATGVEHWKGILLGEDEFRRRAAAHGESVRSHRQKTQSRYRTIIRALEGVVNAVERTS